MEEGKKKVISVALVDDNLSDQIETKKALTKYQEETNIEFHIDCFDDGKKFLGSNLHTYDIVFMDMMMPSIDGIETSLALRKVSAYTNIIIVSSSPNYAIKGYSVNALAYVLKPINYKYMKTIIDKAVENVKNSEEGYLFVSSDGEKKKIYIKDIIYVEVFNHDLFIVTDTSKYKIRSTLEEFSKKFAKYGFSKCNRCYLVNLRHVISFDNKEVTVSSYKLPISKLRKKEFEKEFYDYLGDTL